MGTRERAEATEEQAEARLQKLQGAVRTILECIGEDPEREGLLGTPERYARAMLFFTKGYEENVRDLVNGAVFHEDHDELVIVQGIEVFSLCEHHMVPFTGKVRTLIAVSINNADAHARCISATCPIGACSASQNWLGSQRCSRGACRCRSA